MPSPLEDPESLLAEAAWLRRLARSLVADAATADDLVQDTTLAAIRRGPRADVSLRGWLVTVLRNAARKRHRDETRRHARERLTAPHEAQPSTAEALARLQAQRRVLDAVEALDEPYRSTVLMHWFEGLKPGAIARRMGVPVATVRTRLLRARDALRRRLRDEYGDERAWLAAVLPLCRSPALGQVAASTLGILAMKKTLIALAVGMAAITAWVWTGGEPATPVADARNATAAPDHPAAAAPVAAAAPERESVPQPEPATAATRLPAGVPSAAQPARTIRGRAFDHGARPLPGVHVRAGNGPGAGVITAPDGAFALPWPARSFASVRVDEPGWTPIFSAPSERIADDDVVLVAAPAVSLQGTVVDEGGAPVAKAVVEVSLPGDFRVRFDQGLVRARPEHFRVESDAAGRFDLDPAPAIPGAELVAHAPGFEVSAQPVPAASNPDLRIVLRRPRPAEGAVSGQVVDPDGRLVEGALVALAGRTAITDREGRFALAVPGLEEDGHLARQRSASREAEEASVAAGAARIVAVKEGFLPGAYDAPLLAGVPQFDSFVVIHLGPEPRSIRGEVRDADDRPLAGARVWFADPTFFGFDAQDSPLLLESVLAGAGDEAWRSVFTDDLGRFEIAGLLDRAYRLEAQDERTLLHVARDGVRAGAAGVILRLPPEAMHERITGRVVTHSREPVSGALIRATRTCFQREGGLWFQSGATAVTDAEGRFELTDVPVDGVYLRVNGDDIVPAEYGSAERGLGAPRGQLGELIIEVTRQLQLRVELADSGSADHVSVVDRAGAELPIAVVDAWGRSSSNRRPLVQGASGVVVVPETATALVLWKGGQEIRRIPLVLRAAEVNVIRG